MKRKNRTKPNKSSVLGKLRKDSALRLTLAVCIPMSWNLLYALFNGILAAVYGSLWFGVMAAYHTVLGGMRLSAVSLGWNRKSKRTGRTVMRHNGAAMFLLAGILSVITGIGISEHRNPELHPILTIGIAAYTFFWAVLSIVNFVKARKKRSFSILTVRNISCVSAVGSMLALERAMFGTFEKTDSSLPFVTEVISGAGAVLLVILIGVSMMAASYRRRPEQKTAQ